MTLRSGRAYREGARSPGGRLHAPVGSVEGNITLITPGRNRQAARRDPVATSTASSPWHRHLPPHGHCLGTVIASVLASASRSRIATGACAPG
jgi:hypothetical protein